MIYKIYGSFLRNHWEIECLGKSLPKGENLGTAQEDYSRSYYYYTFLDDSTLKWGDDIILELLNRGRYLISNYIAKQQSRQPEKLWRNDLGQI